VRLKFRNAKLLFFIGTVENSDEKMMLDAGCRGVACLFVHNKILDS
jgi:hypothetical protein